ncbi:hypothetical protein AVEN_267915-1 [Araneus ventricosus]|uniref:Uncharacterized protein n=1 Tax=Araneus ventricosus TaxID=182803 RepID=A0A4Y2K8F8_ARAVE|nr:hypothetical protein AVEN_267915-1 [Araneus ventricosus]
MMVLIQSLKGEKVYFVWISVANRYQNLLIDETCFLAKCKKAVPEEETETTPPSVEPTSTGSTPPFSPFLISRYGRKVCIPSRHS